MARAPLLLAADFLRAFQALLPRGLVWPREPDAVQTQALAALMPTYERQAARSNQLLVDAFPSTTTELLPQWEATLGLPDPCQGLSPTLEQRRAQVVARFTGRGQSLSVGFFLKYAATLGYPTTTITLFTVAKFGQVFGLPMNGAPWAHTWLVTAPTPAPIFFQFGAGAFGEPFAVYGTSVLQCEFQRLQPAQTVLLFALAPGAPPVEGGPVAPPTMNEIIQMWWQDPPPLPQMPQKLAQPAQPPEGPPTVPSEIAQTWWQQQPPLPQTSPHFPH